MRTHGSRTGIRVGAMVIGGIAGALVLGLGALLSTGGLFVPARYLDAWDKDYHRQFSDPRLQLVALGLLAPSGHNMQPWIVRLDPADPHAFDVYVDAGRLTPAVDPDARQTMVSVGTFLEYIRVAGGDLGWATTTALFPDGGYDEQHLAGSMRARPAAHVTITASTPAHSPEYDALFLSDTNRDPYGPSPLTNRQRDAIGSLTGESDVTLRLLEDQADKATLGAFGKTGTEIEARDDDANAEMATVFRSNEWQKDARPWGFAVEGQGTSGIMKYLTQGLLTLFPSMNEGDAAAQRAIDLTKSEVAATPAYGIIETAGNTRVQQIRAGMLYSRFELRARSLGLVMQPLSQVLQEYPAMATPYAAVHAKYAPDGGTIQMIVRLGTPTKEYPPSMRRSVQDICPEGGAD